MAKTGVDLLICGIPGDIWAVVVKSWDPRGRNEIIAWGQFCFGAPSTQTVHLNLKGYEFDDTYVRIRQTGFMPYESPASVGKSWKGSNAFQPIVHNPRGLDLLVVT
jgi:hypothetical protein